MPPLFYFYLFIKLRSLARLDGAQCALADLEPILRTSVDAAVLAATQLADVARRHSATALRVRDATAALPAADDDKAQ